jgi:hypothetical protein
VRRQKPNPPKDIAARLKTDYVHLRQLDAQGWYVELTRLYRLSVDHKLRLHAKHRHLVALSDAGVASIVHVGGPYASFIVNVNAPDAIITAQFERWREEVRKQIKAPVAKPGQRAPNGIFDDKKFGIWMSVSVVQFVDLLAWRATLAPSKKKEVLKSDLGRWIGRNSSKAVHTTESITKKALACIVSLGAQVEQETLNRDPSTPGLIAARIQKDIERPFPAIRRTTGNDSDIP